MRLNVLLSFIVLLIIGVFLTTTNNPPILLSIGGIFALIGGLGFAVYIIRLFRGWD